MSLKDPIAGKRILDQVTLVPIFIAYLKLQLQKDLEKASRDPHYIPRYHPKEVQLIIAQIKLGLCSGFSAFLGHKLLRGKFPETLTQVEALNILKANGFKEDGSFQDNGKYLISQKKSGTPEGEELNRKYNPMVALLEDILSNMRWLQGEHEIPFRDIWDEYEFPPEVNKEFISILSEDPILAKNLIAFCQKNFQIEEGLLSPEIFNKETMAKLKTIFQQSGEKSTWRYLDQLLEGALEKFVEKRQDLRTTVMQSEWDKLINFVVGEETPKLQHNFSIHFVFKKEELENMIQQVFSSLESTKMIRLRSPEHAVLMYKENENYYFSDPNNGRLLGPFSIPFTKESFNELISIILELFPYHTTNFEFGIDVFGDPIKSKLDKPLDAAQMISELLNKREETYGNDFVELSGHNGWTALHLAARHGHLSVVQELLKRKVDISATDLDGGTALHLAAEYGHVKIVQLLIEKGAMIEASTKMKYTALHQASQHGHIKVVQELLEKGAMIDASTRDGYTALHIAVMTGHLNVVQLLLEREAMIEATDWLKYTALHIAAKYGHLNIVQLLIEKGAMIEAINSDGETALHLAAKNGHHNIVQKLIEKKADIAATNPDGYNALHLAAKNGHHKVVEILIENKANIEEINVSRQTALHLAAEQGHPNVVEVLIENKANIAATNRQDETALHIAARKGHLRIIQMLLEKKSNIAATDSSGDTPLHLAAKNGHFKIVQALLAANANINLTNHAGQTALQIAKDWNQSNIVKLLESDSPETMREDPPIAGKRLLNQVTLVPIFIAYLKLQLQKDIEKASRDPQYIRQYHEKDIEAAIAQIESGICSAFCAFLGHKLIRGKLEKTIDEVELLNILKAGGFKEDRSFQDDGKYLMSQKKFGTPEGEELNRKYNPMVELLEDILSNMRWLQSGHEIAFRDIWDEYELAPEVNKEFISILSEDPIETKNLIAFCQKNFQIEEALLSPEIFNKETMIKLKTVFQKSHENEKSALRYLDQLLKGALEKSVSKEKDLKTRVMQTDWDKLINFVVDEETPKLQNNFKIHSILKKEEVEDIIQQVLSSFKSTKILRLRIPQHTLLVYKEGENYYFSDPNDGRLLGPYTKDSANALTALVLELFPYNTTNFEFGIDVFGDPIRNKLDKPLDPAQMMSELLKRREKTYGGKLVDLSNNKGWTSLHLAATNGYLPAVEELLKNKADIGATNLDGWTALHLAAEQGHLNVVQKLLENGANREAVLSSGETPLHVAAMNGHLNVVQELLEKKANIEAITPNKFTALHLAAKHGHLNVVEALLNKKIDLAAINLDDETALHLAATHGHLDVVQKLLEEGAAIETPNWQKNTALHLAAKNGHLNVVQKLIEKGARIDTPNSDGETSLHLAVKNGHLNVIQMLLEKGAKIETPNSSGKTAFYLAVEEGHLNVMHQLLKKKPNIAATNKQGFTVLHLAALRGDINLVRELLDAGANIKAINSNGETALHLAARNGHLQLMRELIKNGAKLEVTNSKGETALELADRNGHTEVVKFFKNRLNIHLAAEEGRLEDVQESIEKGADINATNSEGYTALHLAAKNGHLNVVRKLLEAPQHGFFNSMRELFKKEARIESRTSDSDKYTPLHLAAKHGQLNIVLELLEKGAKIEAFASEEYTALHLAASKGQLNVVQALLKKGAKIEAKTKGGYTPLLVAAINGHVNIVQELLKNKANIAATTSYGYTALHLATFNPYEDFNLVVRELLKKGAKIEAADRSGNTVLHLAAEYGKEKIMQELIAANANINLTNKARKTPLQVAKDNKVSKIVKILESCLQPQPAILSQQKLHEKQASKESDRSKIEPDVSKTPPKPEK